MGERRSALKRRKRDKSDRNDIRNYTEVQEVFFDEIFAEYGNKDEKLKMLDDGSTEKPVFLVWSAFLIKD